MEIGDRKLVFHAEEESGREGGVAARGESYKEGVVILSALRGKGRRGPNFYHHYA